MKKKRIFNHIVACIIILSIVVALIPVNNVEAANKPRLNKTAVTVTSDKSIKLKVLNSSKKWKWKTSNKKIAIVDNRGNVYAVKPGTCTVTATYGKKKLKCKVTVKLTDKEMIYEASQWLCDEMWNKGLCDLGWYYKTKRDACGEKLDIEKTLRNFNKNYKKITKYNNGINSLKGSKYKTLKTKWNKIMIELERLHEQVNQIDWSKCPYDDEKFDNQEFSDELNDIYYYMLEFVY